MPRTNRLKPAPGGNASGMDALARSAMNRRQFLKYGFNAAGGVLAVAAGALGYATILMPGGGSGAGDLAVKYWAKGREDEAWYGAMHLGDMKKSDFEAEAANSSVGMAGAQGVWNGLPVNVTYVPHDANSGTPLVDNKPRFQFTAGTDQTGAYVAHFEDLAETDDQLRPTENLVLTFSRCPHLCCIPGWQLVSNSFTDDNWTPGGGDDGGSKMFCICHSSRFDPTVLEANRNRNRSNGSEFTYVGIKCSGGPAPVGMPLIPIKMNGDIIEGVPDYIDWLTYCD